MSERIKEAINDLPDKVIERNEKAHKMIKDLCRRKGDPESREWIMRIPADEDYDPDLVIGASLRDVPKLLKKIETLQGALELASVQIVDLTTQLHGPPVVKTTTGADFH
jgi:hypothetical protein